MNRLSIMPLSAALAGLLVGTSGVGAQDVAGPPETPRCSFVCALAGNVPSDPKPVAAATETAPVETAPPERKRVADRAHREKISGGRRATVATSELPSRHGVTRTASARHLIAKVAEGPAALPGVPPMPHPTPAVASVDLQPQAVESPIVQVESEQHADAAVPRRDAERASSDLHLASGLVAGDVETTGFTRSSSSWDWLITQAHAATVKRPDPYGDLGGVRKAF